MTLLRFLLAPSLVVFGACAMNPGTAGDSDATLPDTDEIGGAGGMVQPHVAGSKSSSYAGKRGSTNTKRDTAKDNAGATDNSPNTAEQAGAGPLPEPPLTSTDPVHESCELDGGCTAQCEDTTVTCGVESTGIACEFEGFTGATAEVACGQRLIVGTACCGGCGCVPVELFFDGTRCWQGIPGCGLDQFNNRLFDPHATTTPNPSFIPPPSFYLGGGGIGGGDPVLTAGGASGAGAGGAGGTGGTGAGGIAGNGRVDSGGATQVGGAPTGPAEGGGAGAPQASAGAPTGPAEGGEAGAAPQATAGGPARPAQGGSAGLD
ncbi:MAG TPA: hypothetical protein VJV79_09095 [Polyangiaceae bacterium]|nr:hypothetical protein [Polyangiaceae bacterium]